MTQRGMAARETQDDNECGPRADRKARTKSKRRWQAREAGRELAREYNSRTRAAG